MSAEERGSAVAIAVDKAVARAAAAKTEAAPGDAAVAIAVDKAVARAAAGVVAKEVTKAAPAAKTEA